MPGMLGGTSLVSKHPVGVVGAIVPWNVPQGISFLKLAPALAAGCSVVLKPAEETVLDAFLMAEAAAAAGLPDGVVNVVPGGREVGAYLVEHPGVDKVSFTGSTAAGRWIAEACGRLLRPVTLELGGKSAGDRPRRRRPGRARSSSFFGVTLLNNGQICWLNTRVLAPRSRYTEIVDTITDLARSLTVGDPLDPQTKVGPLVSERQRDRVEGYIAKGKSEGARMTTGGSSGRFDRGWFLEPTIFADVDNDATVAREEIFGPVLSVIPYSDVTEAVRDRQRQCLRPGRERVVIGSRTRRQRRPPRPLRDRRGQSLRQRSRRPVRRHQAKRHGTRTRSGGTARVPGLQDDLHAARGVMTNVCARDHHAQRQRP